MKALLLLLAYILTTLAKLLGPSGAKAVVADSLLLKQQLLVINRYRRRAPNLSALDRPCTRRRSLVAIPNLYAQNSVTIPGYRTAMDFIRH